MSFLRARNLQRLIRNPKSEIRNPLDHCPDSPLEGNGSSGGRSCDFCFFWISISDTSNAGDTAETGTLPDSAPQYPLKTSGRSEVAMILLKLASGVPTISAPRTSSSGRPSAYTRYTINGI